MSRQIPPPDVGLDLQVDTQRNRVQQRGGPPGQGQAWTLTTSSPNTTRVLPALPVAVGFPIPVSQQSLQMIPPPPFANGRMNNLNMPRADSTNQEMNSNSPHHQRMSHPPGMPGPGTHMIPRLVRHRSRRDAISGPVPAGNPAEVLSRFYGSNVSNPFDPSDLDIVERAPSHRPPAPPGDEEPSTSTSGESDMPDSPERTTSHGFDHWSSSFKCPVCLDYLRQPIILPCGHSFCKTCVWRLVYHRADEFRNVHPHNLFFFCPTCRKRVQARNFARYSPSNIALAAAIEGYLSSEERKTSLLREAGKTCETQTSDTTVPHETESVSTQTELRVQNSNEDNSTATSTQSTPNVLSEDVPRHISKDDRFLLTQQARLFRGLNIEQETDSDPRCQRSESAPPGLSKTGGRTVPGAGRHDRATDGHVWFRDATRRREVEEDEEQEARHRTIIFLSVFVISALIILDGCISHSRERLDASPLQVAAWASLLSTAPTFIQLALKACCSLVKLVTRQILRWRS